MTKLIVEALDLSAPGSYALRDTWLTAYIQMSEAKRTAEFAAGYAKVRDLVIARATTDDGTPVADALAQISAEQFDALIGQVLSGGEETIPPVSSGS